VVGTAPADGSADAVGTCCWSANAGLAPSSKADADIAMDKERVCRYLHAGERIANFVMPLALSRTSTIQKVIAFLRKRQPPIQTMTWFFTISAPAHPRTSLGGAHEAEDSKATPNASKKHPAHNQPVDNLN
jgi:hypothetical protein